MTYGSKEAAVPGLLWQVPPTGWEHVKGSGRAICGASGPLRMHENGVGVVPETLGAAGMCVLRDSVEQAWRHLRS